MFIKEGPEATRAFEFRCSRWLSPRDDDGQIIRDLPVSDVFPASHLVAVLPRIDERRDDDFYKSHSESESFSSGEDEDFPSPDLREVKKKSRRKDDSLKVKPPLEAPVPALEKRREDGFLAVNAENLLDASDRQDQPDDDKFFELEDKNEESEGELSDSGKRSIDEESSNESEEERNDDKAPDNRKLVSNAVSSFKGTGRRAKSARRESESEEEQQLVKEDGKEAEKIEKEEEGEEGKSEEDENEKDEEDKEEEEEPQATRVEEKEEGIKADEKEEEEEEEPRVEFSGDTKPQVNVKIQLGIFKIRTVLREQAK